MAYQATHRNDQEPHASHGSGSNTVVNILLWVLFGGLAGWLASLVTGDAIGLGILGNVLVGIAGAFVGGFIADRVQIGSGGPGADRPTSIASFIWAVIGAVLLLLLLNFLF